RTLPFRTAKAGTSSSVSQHYNDIIGACPAEINSDLPNMASPSRFDKTSLRVVYAFLAGTRFVRRQNTDQASLTACYALA
ncbi:MAG TPA: hypothetical protein VFM05_14610, partial [Candidatus Saccharimonadales bacterium]|nr:hypothetical protein [Candidatus Saccharimonadales bacterium]